MRVGGRGGVQPESAGVVRRVCCLADRHITWLVQAAIAWSAAGSCRIPTEPIAVWYYNSKALSVIYTSVVSTGKYGWPYQ